MPKSCSAVVILGVLVAGQPVDHGGAAHADGGLEALSVSRLQTERLSTILQLEKLLMRRETDGRLVDARIAAARALGEILSFESTPLLLADLELTSPTVTRIAPLARHPAAEALVRIGSKSYDGIYRYLARNDLTERKAILIAYIVKEIDGSAVGRFRVEQWLSEHESNSKQSAAHTGVDQTNQTLVRNLRRLSDLLANADLEKVENWPYAWSE